MKLSQLAVGLSNCQLDLQGDDPEITGVAAIDRAQAGEITFLGSSKYLAEIERTQASAVILDLNTPCKLPCLRTNNPRLLFAKVLERFHQPLKLSVGIHPTAVLGEGVQLGKNIAIAAGVVIGDRVTIGDGVSIFPNTVIYDDVAIGADTTIHSNCTIVDRTQIGANCLIHPGTAIGGDGFGFELQADGSWYKIPQTGYVILGDKVEIGCLTAIDRPAVGTTRIGTGTKIDNLVQIGHGANIAPHCILVSQVGLAGGVTLGHHAVLAGQVGVGDRAAIGEGALVGAKSGVISHVDAGAKVLGFPAIPERERKRIMVAELQLPEMLHTIRKLEKRIAELERKIEGGN
ncbi:UDP-3-O-(3-hydroxymyristoyl)glucosamine N-acyltransferase [Tumidithrix elongata RA019]|uniref:UDP-3-O-acylglucosamine N-acyltransferase n=1 Tax=Tumidithrix elongata BACA0141 TaxID=2716417 RepID=A0AAW9Q4A7_9CYAN|nr:UDP-3-O-(3-hydroxymyristoyl)glucosamine N-acyltransferase [Tumidithrix elongata RA019]